MMSPLILVLAAFAAICKAIPEELKCTRIRRAMHEMTEDELMMYVDGLQAIRANGKYQIMVDAHSQYTEVHRGSSFFFYHTYFVWEVETQIRQLGGRFTCFALPYYDWTVDAGKESDPWILNTVLGGNGDKGVNNCVTDPRDLRLWGIDKWPIRELCGPPEDVQVGCCLKRNLDTTQRLSNPKDLAPVIEVPFFHEFLGGVLIEHQRVHWLFGQEGDECVSCHMATGYSPDDPIFMVLHSFVAYLRALWAGCHGYDNIDSFILDNHPDVYTGECIDGFEECGAIELDEPYFFGPMAQADWSLTHKQDITPRDIWNFEAWRVKYDFGTFWDDSGLITSDMCDEDNLLNSRWFSQQSETMEMKERIMSDWAKELESETAVSDDKPKPLPKEEKPAPKPEDKPAPKDTTASDQNEKPAPKPDKPPPKPEDKPNPPPLAKGKEALADVVEYEAMHIGLAEGKSLEVGSTQIVMFGGVALLLIAGLLIYALSCKRRVGMKSKEERPSNLEMYGSILNMY